MTRSRIAVLGGGHLGSIHARLVQDVADAELTCVVEPSEERAAELRQQLGCPVETDVQQFVAAGDVDGVVVAAPTTLHHNLGCRLLQRGIHCLIEKPLAPTPLECRSLANAARQSGAVLQVGHVERFNPVWRAFTQQAGAIRHIEAHREGPLAFRSLDAGVVLDLMIHDIDLVLSAVPSRVVDVQATGFSWTGPSEDIAQARIEFANGCVAQLTASRVSCQPRREMRLFGADWYGEVDFASRSGFVVHRPERDDWQSRSYTPAEREDLMQRQFSDVTPRQTLDVPEANPILDELRDFVGAIRNHDSPRVTGEDGLAAVEIAHAIVTQVGDKTAVTSYRKAG